jgi:hypothetical protein
MTAQTAILPHKTPAKLRPYGLALLVLLLVAGAALLAQVAGERGIAPVASSTDIEVSGIEVNATGDNPQDARENGWLEAQKIAWERLDGPAISDSQLRGLVSAIVVQREQLGPRRYIATLGVIFDRQRAGSMLGGGGAASRSAPMLTLPVLISGGSATMFEYRNAWQRAWAEYQFGSSAIDYVRPSGAGGESLLLTYGQTTRRSRAWWNTVLDQFSAADVLMPIARLEYSWPGGPVEGHFTARYGPDNRYLDAFSMRADSAAQVPDMLTRAVVRFDEIFARALAQGVLRPDPTLSLDTVEMSPEIRALLEQGRLDDAGAQSGTTDSQSSASDSGDGTQPVQAATVSAITVQVATPDPRSFDGALSGIRGASGVRGVSVSSTAIGGTSVVQVNFAGDLDGLAAALRAAGWQVTVGSNALAISR